LAEHLIPHWEQFGCHTSHLITGRQDIFSAYQKNCLLLS
jgi:hypothetical protein